MIDFDVAYDKLASMETADEIADLFRSYGVKAQCGSPVKCAISAWLQDQTGYMVRTTVYGINTYTDRGEYVRGKDLTPTLLTFMFGFDDGDYPDLIEGYSKGK